MSMLPNLHASVHLGLPRNHLPTANPKSNPKRNKLLVTIFETHNAESGRSRELGAIKPFKRSQTKKTGPAWSPISDCYAYNSRTS